MKNVSVSTSVSGRKLADPGVVHTSVSQAEDAADVVMWLLIWEVTVRNVGKAYADIFLLLFWASVQS